MLAVLADGSKLPPYLILKRKLVPKNETFPKDVVVRDVGYDGRLAESSVGTTPWSSPESEKHVGP